MSLPVQIYCRFLFCEKLGQSCWQFAEHNLHQEAMLSERSTMLHLLPGVCPAEPAQPGRPPLQVAPAPAADFSTLASSTVLAATCEPSSRGPSLSPDGPLKQKHKHFFFLCSFNNSRLQFFALLEPLQSLTSCGGSCCAGHPTAGSCCQDVSWAEPHPRSPPVT